MHLTVDEEPLSFQLIDTAGQVITRIQAPEPFGSYILLEPEPAQTTSKNQPEFAEMGPLILGH